MRVSGIAPQFQPPNRQTPSRKMWIIIALCVVLPPIGLILLWTSARNPLRGKLIISIIAVLSLTLMLTLFFTSIKKQPNEIKNPQIDYSYLDQYQQQQQDTPLPSASPQQQVMPEAVEPEPEVIPSNPMT